MDKHKDDGWLRQQADMGKTSQEIAHESGVDAGTVSDQLRRRGLGARPAMPVGVSEKEILRWCGHERRPIPPDVASGTAPSKHATVVVLGSSGFVGTNLCTYLRHNTSLRVIQARRTECDAMDRLSLQKYLDHVRPDVVVNLAAFVGGIGLNKDNPADMIYRNLMMSANVVDATFTAGVRKLVFLGTVCSYPHTPPRIPFVEDDMWAGRPEPTNEPYGVAKKAVGLMLDAYRRQFNFSSAYLVPTNMYGPHDDFSSGGSHVIPAIIKRFLDARDSGARRVVNWGDGSPTRDFMYVEDCCEAIRLAIEKVDDPAPINVGYGREVTMRQLADEVAAVTGYSGEIVWDGSKPNGQPRRNLDIARAVKVLGFAPRTDLRTGLAETVRWYSDNRGTP